MYDQNVDIHTYNIRQKYNLHVATGDINFSLKASIMSIIEFLNHVLHQFLFLLCITTCDMSHLLEINLSYLILVQPSTEVEYN